jgi:hypothetical protein
MNKKKYNMKLSMIVPMIDAVLLPNDNIAILHLN